MQLVKDHSSGAYAVRVPCLTCGRMVQLSEAVIDRDGPAFRAYYCPDHTPEGPVAPCPSRECRRCPR